MSSNAPVSITLTATQVDVAWEGLFWLGRYGHDRGGYFRRDGGGLSIVRRNARRVPSSSQSTWTRRP